MDRRQILTLGAGLAGAAQLGRPAIADGRRASPKAILFDAFPVFDPRSIAALCEAEFPGRGGELVTLWRTRQFEYAWLRSVANRYADFERVTEDALNFAAEALKLDLGAETRARLLGAHFRLKAWPDALPALTKLKQSGLRLAFLSNFTPAMLKGCSEASGLGPFFEQALSVDAARTYKPDARAYHLGVEALALPREDILFVAFAGWDAAGAASYGYRTFWVNRLGLPAERLGAAPDGTGSNLADLLAFLG
ncbi:haloacid dehalogenase type II [Methylosinus sp. Sm6]|uniref:haloacid dehalogenase type II n=1 Tax=Methylosinus sp. Sm6 TaxID=2866948 RepID=UPI001C99DEB7|nr:haloacid dehalogenase type II [Methylosinus sp. Sm6]MBY6243191.1 haloacid dehalogenase type II [Methylosinus sp. Sm6]